MGSTPRHGLGWLISSRAAAQGPTFRAPAAMMLAPVRSCPFAVKHTTATANPIRWPARTPASHRQLQAGAGTGRRAPCVRPQR